MLSTAHPTHAPATPDQISIGLARSRPDLCKALLATVNALSSANVVDERTVDRFVLVGWLEWRGTRVRLTEAGNLVYAFEARRAREALGLANDGSRRPATQGTAHSARA